MIGFERRPSLGAQTARRWLSREPESVWGDGFAELEPALLWRASDWSVVEDDELVFLIPGLPPADLRPGSRLAAILARGVQFALQAASRATAIEAGVLERALVGVATDALHPPWPTGGAWKRATPAVQAFWASAYVTAWEIQQSIGRGHASDGHWSDADIVLVSALTGVNGAWFLPHGQALHESLGLAAWLGQLLRGRPALMPLAFAERVGDLQARGVVASPDDLTIALADFAMGWTALCAAAARVRRASAPSCVAPAPDFAAPFARPLAWNPRLRGDIGLRLDALMTRDRTHA